MHDFLLDVRFALRMLRKAPAFTAAALVVLALGIGATSAIFSVVNAVVLRPLPYPDSDRITVVHTDFRVQGLDQMPCSIPEFNDFRAQSRSFEALAAYQLGDANLGGVDPPERLQLARVSPAFFPAIRVEASPGRTFTPEEEKIGNERVALISHALWQRRFGGDPAIVGRSIALSGTPHTVTGVMPRGFSLPSKVDVWVPLAPTALDASEERRNWRNFDVIGRLKPGVTTQQAQEEMTALRRGMSDTKGEDSSILVLVKTLKDFTVGDTRTTLLVLLGAVAFVLLIACANVANLLLARTAVRQREIAVRAALGAGSGRLALQFLVESVVLALLGGALGLLLALWGVDALVAIDPDRLPRGQEIRLDGIVIAFTLGVSLLTGIVFGVIPALHAGRVDPAEALKEGSRGTAGGRMGRFRNALVVVQIALALVLLAGAGLMTRSLSAMTRAPLGFDPGGVLTARIPLPVPKYEENKAKIAFVRELLERVRQLPGVSAAGVTSQFPIATRSTQSFTIEGRSIGPDESWPYAIHRYVSPGYFETMRVPLIAGRLLGDQDSADAPRAIVVNQALVAKYFPKGDALGARITPPCGDDPKTCPPRTIVGVVGDVREVEVEETLAPAFYGSYFQAPWHNAAIAIRTSQDPAGLISALRSEVRAVDRDQPIYDVLTMEARVDQRLGPRRFALQVLVIFAVTALILAAVGLYGVTSYMVAQRTREFGIRLALGAEASDILGMVLKKSLMLTGIGLGVGVLASLALSRVMASVIYGVSAQDPLTLAIAGPVLAAAALLASFFPARRATRVPPAIALRAE
jgi:predicted permease